MAGAPGVLVPGSVRRKARRYWLGVTPRAWLKWRRKVSGLPNPLRTDTEAMVSLPRSRRRAASRTRCRFTHEPGVAPVRCRNRRAKVRGDIDARAARASTVSGWARG